MKQNMVAILPLLIGVAVARPALMKREVPQEHAHQNILDIIDQLLQQDNPNNIQASVFGLLGAKAAAEGAGNIADADCLQLATADQAFTNAKAANDVDGQTAALIYRALERNSGKVGQASPACASIQAVNPEIAALQQHQDPAGDGAQDLNKQIAAELAVQIASIGGDPQQALEASTFQPGDPADPTAKGFTCDDENDKAGCINSQNLRVDDLKADEVDAAVQAGSQGINAGAAAGNASAAAGNAAAGNAGKANQNEANANKGADNAANANKNEANANKNADKNAAQNEAKANKNADKNAAQNEANADKQADKNAANANKNEAANANKNEAANANKDAAAADKNAANQNAAKANENANNADQANNAQDNAAAANNAGNQAAAGNGAAAAGAAGALDFGQCADPTIKFGIPSDGRKEEAFEATDLTNFNHGSALNIKVISEFICDQLTNKCKASADTVTACDAASAQSANLKGQAAADSFNQALGF